MDPMAIYWIIAGVLWLSTSWWAVIARGDKDMDGAMAIVAMSIGVALIWPLAITIAPPVLIVRRRRRLRRCAKERERILSATVERLAEDEVRRVR